MAEISGKVLANRYKDNGTLKQIPKEWHSYIEGLNLKWGDSRTARYWLMFMRFISIVRVFIRVERTGNWDLHSKASQDILPFFAASGHNNNPKCARIYLQESSYMCGCHRKAMSDGLFSIRRNPSLFWSGTWTDLTIEQCLM